MLNKEEFIHTIRRKIDDSIVKTEKQETRKEELERRRYAPFTHNSFCHGHTQTHATFTHNSLCHGHTQTHATFTHNPLCHVHTQTHATFLFTRKEKVKEMRASERQ